MFTRPTPPRLTAGPFRCGLLLAAAFMAASCNGEEEAITPPADIRLEITDFRYERAGDRDRYYHIRRFIAGNTTGATITRGRVCVEQGKICIEAAVQYRIEGEGQFQQSKSYFATRLDEDRITLEYWLTDDTGTDHHLSEIVTVKNRQAVWVSQ